VAQIDPTLLLQILKCSSAVPPASEKRIEATDKNVSLDEVIKRSAICPLSIATIRTTRVGVDGPTSGNTIR